MENIEKALALAVISLVSDQNYAQSLASYRFWSDVGHTYHQIPPDQIFDVIWKNRGSSSIDSQRGQIFHPTAHLIVRFVSDTESDRILAPYTPGLQSRLCTKTLHEFFSGNPGVVWDRTNGYGRRNEQGFYSDANLIAHWANLGYVEEAATRHHVLQSLISYSSLWDHQADALIILFKLAGATFEAYADPSVVDRCFELLKNYCTGNPARRQLVEDIAALRERGWEGLPPPPIFTTGKPKSTGTDKKDPAATPVVTSLGLPNRDPEPQIHQPPSPESFTAPGADTIPASPVTPATQSPSISIATLSDFTIADTSDDETSIDPTFPGPSDSESPVDPTAIAPHEIFYLEDGNVEVLCGTTLFRVHTSVLSFHSPALRRMFAGANLVTAESPNGCPRIQSSDTAADFTTLLKMIYLPGFPEKNKIPDFVTFSSLLRITTKYEMPTVRSQVLDVVRDAYPETFEGLAPSKQLGESIFSGTIPHPNEVLNLFVQQNITSALPMAYYMAARRGLDSLMDRHLPASARLPPEILQVAIRGLMTLREVELNETHRLVFGLKGSHPCSVSNCPSRSPTSPAALEAYQKVFDHLVGSPQLGTKVLQVPEFYEDHGGDLRCVGPGICSNCVERWESGRADLRMKAWGMLPKVFAPRG